MLGLYHPSPNSLDITLWESIPIRRLNCHIFYSIGRNLALAEELIRGFQRRPDPLPASDVQGYFGALKGPLHWITVEEKRNPFPNAVPDAADHVNKRLQFVEYPDTGIVSKLDLAELATSIKALQTVLQFEGPDLPIYLTSRRGMYHPNDLVDHADEHLTDEAMEYMPEQCRIDIRAAGRCLAFDVETASAFHMLRAIESALGVYYHRLTGKTFKEAGVTRNWGKYIEALREAGAIEGVIIQLEAIRITRRNPILHPEENVDRNDGLRIFNNGLALIEQIALGMKAAPPSNLE